MAQRIEFHPEAADEVAAAYDWYSKYSESVARAFLRELDHSIEVIAETPDRCPGYDSQTLVLSRFPFTIIYRPKDTATEIVAVEHQKRRPRYWKSRL
jgi:plasmid stabilization system protein ParE